MLSLKLKVSLQFIGQFFDFKFELVAYSEDFFKIVLAIIKPELAITRTIAVFVICIFFKKILKNIVNSPCYMSF